LKRGRYFNEHDSSKAQPVVIIDERLAEKFWPGMDPIGKRLHDLSDGPDPSQITPKTRFWTVVGVVANVHLAELSGDGQPVGAYYFSLDQDSDSRSTLAIKTSSDPAALARTLRAEMTKIDRDIPLFDVRTMDERTQLSLTQRRAAMILGLAFAGIALFLSAIGIYGVLIASKYPGDTVTEKGARIDSPGLIWCPSARMAFLLKRPPKGILVVAPAKRTPGIERICSRV